MNVKTNAEKEWLRKLTTGKPVEKKEQAAPVKVAAEKENKRPERKDAHGFRDVAGMDELKQMVTEGFINVLNNQECAKAFGITPPSLLFYGPAGCGKTFFAEKIAEEVGINFMKIVPDDLASTLVHGTQEKIGEVFRKAERKAPTLIFFDEFDSIGKIRDYDQDHGEMKRVVNTLLQLFDYLPENAIVIAATNQLQMIDDALKRRFDLSLELKAPGKEEVKALVNLTIGDKFRFDDETIKAQAIDLCDGLSYYVIKRTLLTSIKRTILDKGITDKIESEKWMELIKNEKKESK